MKNTKPTALVTGGLGFIGSNLTRRLLSEGVSVTIFDASLPAYGANPHNIKGISDSVTIWNHDVRDGQAIDSCVQETEPDYVFHLAAQLSRPHSLEEPEKDVDINCTGTINVLESIAEHSPEATFVFTSSQSVYGVPDSLPLTEQSAVTPIDVYGANKRAGELYAQLYNRVHGLDTTVLRFTNVYGPRAQLENPNYGVINKFIRNALCNDRLTVYKPGTMLRDFVFVEDVVNALWTVSQNKATTGRTYLVGRGESTSIKHLAERITSVAEGGKVTMVDWPDEWDSIRVGDITVDVSRLRDETSWVPKTDLGPGLEQTIDYYRTNLDAYL